MSKIAKTSIMSVMICGLLVGKALAGGINGRVTDLFGHPLLDASVEITAEKGQLMQVATNSKGEFTAERLKQGNIRITVKLRGFKQESADLYLNEDETKVVAIGLEVGQIAPFDRFSLNGTVSNTENKPVNRAIVSLVNAFNQRVRYNAITDDNGKYEIDAYLAGQYVLLVTKEDFEIETRNVLLPSSGSLRKAGFDFTIGPLIAGSK